MLSVVAIGLLAITAHAEEKAADPLADFMSMANSDEFMDKVADKLITKLADSNILPRSISSEFLNPTSFTPTVQSELDRAADRGTGYEWENYNSKVDQRMALEAEAAVALMNQRAGHLADGHSEGNAPQSTAVKFKVPQLWPENPKNEEELVQTSTDNINISFSAVALMACFACTMLALFVRHFRSMVPKESNEALVYGYYSLNA